MRALHKLVSNKWWSLGTVTLAGLLLLLVGLGSFGLWEPHEMAALTAIDRGDTNAPTKATKTTKAEPSKAPPKAVSSKTPKHAKQNACAEQTAPVPLSKRLIQMGRSMGDGELAARLPLAICGVLVVLLTWLLGRLVASPRAGLFAAAVALTFPAIIFGSRQLTGDMVNTFAATLTITGAAFVLWPHEKSHRWTTPVGAAAAALGLFLGYQSSGLLLGVVAPSSAIAIAGLAFSGGVLAQRREGRELPPRSLQVGVVTVISAVITLAAVAAFIGIVFDWATAGTDDYQLFGSTLAPCLGSTKAAMGSWRLSGDLEINFNALVEQIAFGAFPWVAVAPIALGRLAFAKDLGRRVLLGHLLFAWPAMTWLVAGIVERKIGPVLFPAIPALAVAGGIFIDEYWPSSEEGEPRRPVAPLIALFAALAVLVIAKDIGAFPERLLSIHVAGATYEYPKGMPLRYVVTGFAVLFALALFAGTAVAPSQTVSKWWRWVRFSVPAALALSLLLALFFAHIWTAMLSKKLSSRHTFDVLAKVKKDGEGLGVLGRLGEGPRFYAGKDAIELKNRDELYDFLSKDERVFALVPVGDHCTLHGAQPSQGFEYFVLDDQNSKHLLLSNQLRDGERDKNKLAKTILRSRPQDIGQPVSVDFDNKLKLIGIKMPPSVDRGDTFEMTLFFEVKQRLRRNWNIFLHFDGSGQRFQGDHKPSERFCGATQWRPGDIIADTVKVKAGGLTYARGRYKLWIGLFTGSAGNWTNMKITTPGADDADRFPVSEIEVQ